MTCYTGSQILQIGFIRILPVSQGYNKYDDFLLVHGVEETVVSNSVTVVVRECSFQSFDVWSEERVGAQKGIDIGANSSIDPIKIPILLQLLLKGFSLGYLVLIRRWSSAFCQRRISLV